MDMLSQNIIVVLICSYKRSLRILFSHIVSHVAFVIKIYLVLHTDNATAFYFLENHDIILFLKLKLFPVVHFLTFWPLTQTLFNVHST